MNESSGFDIQPGPWGIGPSKRGGTEINFDKVSSIDNTGERPKFTLPNGETIVLPEGIKTVNMRELDVILSKPKPSEIVVEKDYIGDPFVLGDNDPVQDAMMKNLGEQYKFTETLVKGKVIIGDKNWELVRNESGDTIKAGKYYIYKEVTAG